MADNVNVTPGSGAIVAADDIGGGVLAQRVKPVFGPDGTGTDVSTTSGLPVQGTQGTPSSTSWTSATTLNTANSVSVSGMNTISVACVATTTVTGGVLTFEVSPDNTNWFPISMARIDSFMVENTYALVASTSRAWSTSVDGFTNFRVRLSTAITGTATVTLVVIPQTFAIEPIVNAGIATRTVGGMTPFTLISAATTNATAVKTSAATLYGVQASNTGTTVAFLKLYNLATAPTVGTSVATKTLIIPAGGGIVLAGNDIGTAFGTGLSLAITGLATTADTTAVALAQVVVNIDYS